MRDFGAASEEDGLSFRTLCYWALVAAVGIWTAWCAVDLSYMAYAIYSGKHAVMHGWPATWDKGTLANAVFLGYAGARAFWWGFFSVPLGLIALLIKPKA